MSHNCGSNLYIGHAEEQYPNSYPRKDEVNYTFYNTYYSSDPTYVTGAEQSLNSLTINQNSPIDYYNSTSQSISFDCNATDETGVLSLNLTINGSVYETVTGAGTTNLSLASTETLADGYYNWYCIGDDDDGSKQSTTRYLTVDTTPFIDFVTPPTLVNYTNITQEITQEYIPMKVNVTPTTYFKNITYYLENENTTSYTQFYTTETYDINFTNYPDAHYHYNVTVCTTTDQCNSTETRHLNHDATAPTITITSPDESNDYGYLNKSIDLNWTTEDVNLDACWYNYNGTNITVTCGDNHTTINLTTGGVNQNFTFYVNDTFGNENSTFYEWGYSIFETNRSYPIDPLQSSLNDYQLNITSDGTETPFAYLVYNGTAYLSDSSNTGNDYIFSNSIYSNVPGNISFYWYINYDGSAITLRTSYHNVITLSEDLFNVSTICGDLDVAMFWDFNNEINRTELESASIYYNFKFGVDNNTASLISGELTNINNFSLCINSSLYNNYNIGYGEIQYEKSGYSDRRWHVFENTRATNNTVNNTLYLLPSGSSTSFLIEARDNALAPFVNKYISLLRWYPEIDEYQIVEMGKTDDKGQTITKVEIEDVDYRIGLYERTGNLIYLASPIRMICIESPCTYILNVPDETSEDFENLLGVDSSLTFAGGAFKYTYNDPSQETSLMQLDVYKVTGTAKTLICTDNATAYTGVLICNVSTSTGQLKAETFRSASPSRIIATLWHNMTIKPFKSTFGLFLTFLVSLTLFLMGIAMPIASIILGLLALIIGIIIGSITYSIVIGISIIAGIIIHFMRKSI